MNNRAYVLKHAQRYQQSGNPDCLWRIASSEDLFGDALDEGGKLTSEQKQEVESYIKQQFNGEEN